MSDRDPDEWWHSLPRERREQIHRWIEQPDPHVSTPGQHELFDITDTRPPT